MSIRIKGWNDQTRTTALTYYYYFSLVSFSTRLTCAHTTTGLFHPDINTLLEHSTFFVYILWAFIWKLYNNGQLFVFNMPCVVWIKAYLLFVNISFYINAVALQWQKSIFSQCRSYITYIAIYFSYLNFVNRHCFHSDC